MSESKQLQKLSRKAFEIAYAAFRVGSSIENRVFVEHLEAWSLSLLEAVTDLNHGKAQSAILNMEYLVSLARDLNFLNPANSDVFLREIRGISSEIAELFASGNSEIDLSSMFTDGPNELSNSIAIKEKTDIKGNQGESPEPSPNSQNNGSFIKSAIRQSAIIEKIRQNKVCRLKDFEEIFPDISERTIRYDVQSLIEREIVERIGNGGPSTAYRLKQEIGYELPTSAYFPS